MKDYKTLILVILAMITIVEFTIKTIPDKNKKNGGSGFAMFTYNKGMVKVCIGSFVFMTLFCGFVFVKTFIDDGDWRNDNHISQIWGPSEDNTYTVRCSKYRGLIVDSDGDGQPDGTE